jgi:DeoR family suf operon transcriptional repressor
MQDTRQQILNFIQRYGPATAADLSDELRVVEVTLRSHISVLVKKNLLQGQKQRDGQPGRPRIMYSLTNEARNSFPKSYDKLASRLLHVITTQHEPTNLQPLFQNMGQLWSSEVTENAPNESQETRLELAVSALQGEGADVTIEKQGDDALISMFNCPYTKIVENFPHVCSMEQSFLIHTLQAEVNIEASGPSTNHCKMTFKTSY